MIQYQIFLKEQVANPVNLAIVHDKSFQKPSVPFDDWPQNLFSKVLGKILLSTLVTNCLHIPSENHYINIWIQPFVWHNEPS